MLLPYTQNAPTNRGESHNVSLQDPIQLYYCLVC